jgi:hypothetical protein
MPCVRAKPALDVALVGRRPCNLDLPAVDVDAGHATRRHGRGEVEGDAADAAAGIEDVHAGAQMLQEEGQEGGRVAAGDVAVLHALVDDVALVHGPVALSDRRGG